MAFAPQDFSVLAYANDFTLWHYKTPDAAVAADYFAAAHPYLRVGDIIVCAVGDGTATARTGLVRVSHVESHADSHTGRPVGRVEVADLAPVTDPERLKRLCGQVKHVLKGARFRSLSSVIVNLEGAVESSDIDAMVQRGWIKRWVSRATTYIAVVKGAAP